MAGRTTYIFLDEIQKVADFEKVVDSLYVKPDVDIYITGSNAYMLSGDLATLLTGRYVEIKMLPLSLKEFLTITELDADRGFAEYLQCGGLPYVARMDRTTEKVETYLEGIYNTVIVKDIEDRQARKESEPSKRKVTDIALLKSIAKYLASVVGSPVSVRSITDYSRRYPAICQQTDADPETGCMEFDIEKGRFSFRLTAPYSEERRRAARQYAKENNAADRLK